MLTFLIKFSNFLTDDESHMRNKMSALLEIYHCICIIEENVFKNKEE